MFFTDQQTRQDLGLISKNDQQSIFSIFDKTATKGGRSYLKALFNSPINKTKDLSERSELIQFWQKKAELLSIDKRQIDFIDHYLNVSISIKGTTLVHSLKFFLEDKWRSSNDYYILKTGIVFIHQFLIQMQEITKIKCDPITEKVSFHYLNHIKEVIENPELTNFINSYHIKKLPLNIRKYDNLLRGKFKKNLFILLNNFYAFEAYKAVGITATELNLCHPEFLESANNKIHLEDLFHLLIASPVKNNFIMDEAKNLCFLTGANMSGKSTLLKSLGIAIYLAQIGFPIPAKTLKITPFDGLFSTINLSDNLTLGHSHFYSEVMRIKEIAEHIAKGKKLFIIFDELFRGTNVKDASIGTKMIIEAFAIMKNSLFIISTHILDIAVTFENNPKVFFRHLKSRLQDNIPTYSYKLSSGVAESSLGVEIIINEKIIEILKAPAIGEINTNRE